MGRLRKTFKNHVENMVMCASLSKSYQQLNTADCGDSLNHSTMITSIATTNQDSVEFANSTTNRRSKSFDSNFGYSCSECGHRGTTKVSSRFNFICMYIYIYIYITIFDISWTSLPFTK